MKRTTDHKQNDFGLGCMMPFHGRLSTCRNYKREYCMREITRSTWPVNLNLRFLTPKGHFVRSCFYSGLSIIRSVLICLDAVEPRAIVRLGVRNSHCSLGSGLAFFPIHIYRYSCLVLWSNDPVLNSLP